MYAIRGVRRNRVIVPSDVAGMTFPESTSFAVNVRWRSDHAPVEEKAVALKGTFERDREFLVEGEIAWMRQAAPAGVRRDRLVEILDGIPNEPSPLFGAGVNVIGSGARWIEDDRFSVYVHALEWTPALAEWARMNRPFAEVDYFVSPLDQPCPS